MKKAGLKHKPHRQVRYEDYDLRERRGVIREFSPVVVGGILLVLAFAFAGHYMGQNASAHNALSDEQFDREMAPASSMFAKGSLLPQGSNFDIVNLNVLRRQAVVEEGKGDLTLRIPVTVLTKQVEVEDVRVVPASIDLTEKPVDKVIKKLAFSPPKAKVEQSFKLKRSERQKVVAQRRVLLAEENCLARAVYFEARSETELGQLAVAKVILNRTRSGAYPKTICGVVYQGSGARNSCQFSFACDGLPDDVKQPGAWAHSKMIAQKAIAGDQSVGAVGMATNYHADYVKPRWAKNMKRLIKIGRHIFYQNT